MDLYLKLDGRRGLGRALYEQIRDAIAEGRLRPGDPLPPSRELARQLGISRHTVTTAYGLLVAEGFLEGASGAGTRVAAPPEPPRPARRPAAVPGPLPRILGLEPLSPSLVPGMIDLRLGTPDTSLFPHAEWRRQGSRAARDRSPGALVYRDAAGDPGLRAAIATWIHRSRGVRASPETVVVTAGAQQAFDLVLWALVRPGDTVAVEDPGYPLFSRLAEVRGARVQPVPVDEHGLVVEALPARARLAYVTPTHQFPLGPGLQPARRHQLLDWARTSGATVIEDDYDSEFRFSARPLEPLQRLDQDDRVLYVGSFSKTLAPALRLGFVVAPPALVPVLAGLRQLADWGSPLVLQRTLAGFLATGLMDRHLGRARKVYHARYQLLSDWLRGPGRRLGRPFAVDAGLHLAVELAPGRDEARLVARARDAGVALEGLSRYALAPGGRRGIALGFGSASLEDLGRATAILGRVIRST